ncbi:MAG TPA: O-antigen ligase family protein [Solirubrobacterales bacterium]
MPRISAGTATVALGATVAAAAAAATVVLGPLALALPVAGGVAYLLVRYPLVLYVAFLYIGLFKGRGAIESSPVDVTLLLGALLAGVCLLRLLEGRFRLPPLMLGLPYVLIATLLAVSLIWTPELTYGTEKTLKFASLTALATFAPFLLVDGRDALRQLLVLLAGVGVVGALIVLSLGSTSSAEGGRLVFNEAADTIFTARFLLTGAFVLLFGAALKLWRRHRLPIAVVGVAVVVIAASIGSRGPLAGFVFAVLCTIVAIVLREPRRVLPVLLAIGIGVAVLPFISLPETSSERIGGLVSNPAGAFNEDLRSRLYEKGFELAKENPVRGIGAGGFFIYSYVVTNREERYPHNVFLEMAAELGLAPTLLLVASILTMLALLYKRAWAAEGDDRTLIYLLSGVFLVNFFATQFSGDFNDNKTFWAMLGLGWLVAAYGLGPKEGSAGGEAPQAKRERPKRELTAQR